MRESAIERHLDTEVRRAGGATRKFLGRKANPDRIVIWPNTNEYLGACVHFIELKKPGGKPRADQARELARLRAMGCNALYLDTKELVDQYVEAWRD